MKAHMGSLDIVSTSRISLVPALSGACYETLKACLSRWWRSRSARSQQFVFYAPVAAARTCLNFRRHRAADINHEELHHGRLVGSSACLEELKRLSERDLDILKGEVRRQLHSNPDIIDALRKVIRPKFEQLVPPPR